jgi:hypothetical protein
MYKSVYKNTKIHQEESHDSHDSSDISPRNIEHRDLCLLTRRILANTCEGVKVPLVIENREC